MKMCSRCKNLKSYSVFTITDFGKFSSWCKDCSNEVATERYHKKKMALAEKKLSQVETVFESENRDRKCKDFSFYA